MTTDRPTITITRITDANTDLLNRIAADVFDAPFRDEWIAQVTSRPDHMLFVALDPADGDRIVGQCLAMLLYGPDRAPALYVDNLGVTPSHRRRGIARRLMDQVTTVARESEAKSLWLGAEPTSDTALPFYHAIGLSFQKVDFCEADLA